MFRLNILFNYASTLISGFLGIYYLPFLVNLVGASEYGVIAIYSLTLTLITFLDLGFPSSLTRTFSTYTIGKFNKKIYCLQYLTTINYIFIPTIVIILIVVYSFSDYITIYLLSDINLEVRDLKFLTTLLIFSLLVRFFECFHRACLVGLEKHIHISIITIIMSILRWPFCIYILDIYQNSIIVYFLLQSLATIFVNIFYIYYSSRYIGNSFQVKNFNFNTIKDNFKFSSSIFLISILSLLSVNIDKILYTNLLSIETFGLLYLLISVSSVLGVLVSPITQFFYPRFCKLVSKDSREVLWEEYKLCTKLILLIVCPITTSLFFYSNKFLSLYTNILEFPFDQNTVYKVLLISNLIGCLMFCNYFIQKAFGLMKLPIYFSIFNLAFNLLSIPILYKYFGIIGAVSSNLVCFLFSLFLYVPIMHLKILKKYMYDWYIITFSFVFISIISVIFFNKIFNLNHFTNLFFICLPTLFIIFVLILFDSDLKRFIFSRYYS